MWIVNRCGEAVNTEKAHTFLVGRFLDGWSVSLADHLSTVSEVLHLTDPTSKEEAESLFLWILQQMEDGKRVVRIGDFRREPMCSGIGGESTARTHDNLCRHLGLPTTEQLELEIQTEGGEA